jgi:hypothetical protein
MSVPESLSTICSAADSRRRTRINLPASKSTVPCYDEVDAVRIGQAGLFYSSDIRNLFEYLGASSSAIAFAVTFTIAFTRERKAIVRATGRVD